MSHSSRNTTRLSFATLGALVGIAALPGWTQQSKTAQAKFFETKVQPILKAKCLVCHTGDGAMGGLNLTNRAAILKGGVSGTSVSLEKPAESRLIQVLHYDGAIKMPPPGKLPQAEIAILTQWVAMGLPWSEDAKAEPAAPHGPPQVNAETMRFWSFQPVKRPAVPKVKNTAWVRSPIDNFVLAKLEKSGLTPAPQASRIALLRRVTYDLTGLPPTAAEINAFLADTTPKAYEKVVDRLLASPHYGERWGRHWLDLVRYAETNSFERDDPKPFAWRYRDYVIKSLNADKPYDRFLKEQLAGDELPDATPETLIATGYYRLGQWDDEPADPDQARYDELDDIVATTGQTMLGLTVNCARCHDHKLDPIPQKDYYKMVAFFEGVNRYGVRGRESVAAASLRPIAPIEEQKRYNAANDAYKAQLAAVQARLDTIERDARPKFSPVDREEFRDEGKRPSVLKKYVDDATLAEYQKQFDERDRLRKSPPAGLEMALCVTESGPTPPKSFLLMRGNPHSPGDEVTPGFLSVLAPPQPVIAPPAPDAKSSGRRTALANWITSPKNPLTARVMANRIWQHHFGRGIVRSSSDFGSMGTPPTHPELLDWLASEFVKQGWRLKPMHKMIVMSSAYRMSSRGNAKALAKDPTNDLMWRFDMRRLSAEEIRDSILAVNGTLDPKRFGPSIYPTIPKEVHAGQSIPGYGWPTSKPEDQNRRSIYVHIKRSLPLPILASHDAADTDFTCPVRFATTQPTQALSMMNSTFTNQQAKIFADFLRKNAGNDPVAQVRLGLRRTLQREPTAAEVKRGVTFLNTMRAEQPDPLPSFCVILLNLNEFIYLD